MVENILNRALDNIEHKLPISPATNCVSMPEHQNILYKNLYLIEFENMYPNIITQMFDKSIIDKEEKTKIDNIKYYLENKSIKDLRYLKKEVNSYFGNLYMKDKKKADLLQQYVKEIYNELYSPETGITNRNKILYIDTDYFFIKEYPCYHTIKVLDSLNIPYEINNIEYAYFKVKKYLAYTDKYGKIQSKYNHRTKSGSLIQEIENKIKNVRRDERIDKILD